MRRSQPPTAKWSVEWRGAKESERRRMRKRGDTGMERRRVRKKRTVISRVIASPDMTSTREHRHQHWLRGETRHTENLGERGERMRDIHQAAEGQRD